MSIVNKMKVLCLTMSFCAISAGILWLCAHPYAISAPPIVSVPDLSQNPHSTGGFGIDAARVDSQITLKIPENQYDEVYQYLKDTYVGRNNLLKDQFPSTDLSGQTLSDVSIFTDEYYDTPNLDLYKTSNSARHRQRINTTDPKDKKSGQELVQVKVTPLGQFDSRTEIKYAAEKRTLGKNVSRDDIHPLIGLIASKKDREDFKDLFEKVSIDPFSLRRIFTQTQTRKRVYIDSDGVNILSFSVDQGSARILWAKGGFTSVDVGLVETEYTAASEEKRKIMRQIRDAVLKDLADRFPALTVNTDSKYGIVLNDLMGDINIIPFLFKYKII